MNNEKGFSLMEVVVSMLVISVVILGIYSLMIFSINVTNDNKYFVEAIEIANQKLEQIRNLPYDDVGTLAGSPVGVIPDYETLVREGSFDIHTTVIFYDDEYDGTLDLGTDNVFLDYKIATVEVTWESKFSSKNVTVFSKIIPNTEETLTGYGLIKLLVNDADGAPVPFTDVHIENNAISPVLNVDYTTNENGELTVAVLPALESYEIAVTKPGYGTDKTYTRGEIIRGLSNDEPTKPHWSVFAEGKTEDSFSIDELGALNVRVVSTNQPDNFLVNEDQPLRDLIKPKMSSDGNGNIYFAWEDYSATSSYIYVQKYDSSLNKAWANDYKVYTTNFQKNPDIVTSLNGNSYVVWQDNSSALKTITKKPNETENYVKNNYKVYNYNSYVAGNYFENIFNLDKLKNNLQKINIFDVFLSQAKAAGASVGLVGVGPGNDRSDSTINLAVPAGVSDGDFLLAFLHHDDSSDGPIDPPSGENWNILNNNLDPSGSSSDSRGAIFWKIADSSEPSYYTFSLGHNEEIAGHIRAYEGVDPNNPFDGSLEWASTSYYNYLIDAPSHTVNNDGSMLVCGWGADTETLGSDDPFFPSGMSNDENNYRSNITVVSVDQEVGISDSPTGTKTFNARQRVTRAVASWCLVLRPETLPENITISSSGSQISTTTIPTSDFYVGGKFVATENNSSRNITSLKIAENGSVDAQNNLSNVRLYYDIDNTFPYDCGDQGYNPGSDSQFGSAEEFDGENGYAEFSKVGGVQVSTVQSLCFYVVLDIESSALNNDSIDIIINNPSIDVTVDSGDVLPDTSIYLTDTTLLLKPAELNQIHYRFRNDDNNEANASWTEEIDYPTQIKKENPVRLRFEVSNEGGQISGDINYRIEYGEKVNNCEDIIAWQALPNNDILHWRIIDSTYFSDGDSTTNIADGLSDENISFIPGEIKDANNQTLGIKLEDDEFTEIEFSIQATNNSTDTSYCFRLTNNGSTDNFAYSVYPEISVIGDENIYIVSLDGNSNVNWGVKRVNTESSNTDQTTPKIDITENYGPATTTIIWTDERSGNQDIYIQGFDEIGNKLWTNDLIVASQATNENSPDTHIDSNDIIYIAWVNEDTSKDIYVQKYNLTGTPLWGSNINLISSSTDEYDPIILTDSSGYFYVSWTEVEGVTEKVYLAKYDSSANTIWKTQANVEYINGPQYENSFIINGSYIYISWTDERSGNQDVYVQKYDLNGMPQWTNDLRINLNSGSSSQNKSFLGFDSSNNNYSVWQDNRNGEFDIYATKFLDSASLNGVSGVPMIVTGTKQVGNNPVILKYVEEFSSGTDGYINIPVEWDIPGYSIELKTDSTSYELIMSDPAQPFEIEPLETKDILIYVR